MPGRPPLGLKPFGQYAFLLFSAGLFNASIFSASILPLSTAYSVCEGLGFETGVDKRLREAPIFYLLYTLLIVAGAGVVLLPHFPLVKMILLSQVLNGVLLPFVLIPMILLINRKDLMGEWVTRAGSTWSRGSRLPSSSASRWRLAPTRSEGCCINDRSRDHRE